MGEVIDNRNSPLRRVFKGPIKKMAGYIADAGISADQVSIGGFVTHVGAMGLIANNNQNEPENRISIPLRTALLAATSLTDAVDGKVAEINGTHNPELDSGLDRWAEFFNHALIMLTNPKTRKVALVAMIAAQFPAIFRAAAEKRGVNVAEFDAGAYPVRKVLANAALIIPEHADKLLLAESAASVYTATKRALAKPKKDSEAVVNKESESRQNMLVRSALFIAVAGIALNFLLNRQEPKK